VGRPLLTPDEVRRLRDEVLVVSENRQALRLKQRPWHAVRALRGRVPPPQRRWPGTGPVAGGAVDGLAAFRRAAPLVAPPLPEPGAEASAPVAAAVSSPAVRPVVVAVPAVPPAAVGAVGGVAAAPPAKPARKAAKRKTLEAGVAQGSAPAASVVAAAQELPPALGSPVPALTRREAGVLAALAADPAASSVVLGGRLGVSSGTARKYLEAVRAKLGVGKEVAGAALVALARARGLLAADAGAGAQERVVGPRRRPVEEG
jgi:DNA-binding CsgD family transcriptional regulator